MGLQSLGTHVADVCVCECGGAMKLVSNLTVRVLNSVSFGAILGGMLSLTTACGATPPIQMDTSDLATSSSILVTPKEIQFSGEGITHYKAVALNTNTCSGVSFKNVTKVAINVPFTFVPQTGNNIVCAIGQYDADGSGPIKPVWQAARAASSSEVLTISDPDYSQIPLCADFNADGVVNAQDDQFLMNEWESSGSFNLLPSSDLDGDSGITIGDLAIAIAIRRESPSTPNAELCGVGSCPTASTTIQSTPISHTSRRVRIEFDATPRAQGIDGVMMIGDRASMNIGDYAIRARFSIGQMIEARNADLNPAYQSQTPVTYTANTPYAFKFEANLDTQTYSMSVRAGSGAEQVIANNYAFSPAATVAQALRQVAIVSTASGAAAGFDFCNLRVTDISVPTETIPSAPSQVAASVQSATSGSVRVQWADQSNNETGFEVKRVGPSGQINLVNVGANTTSLNETLSTSGSYTYSVRSFNSAGFSAASNNSSITLTIPVATGGNELCTQTHTSIGALNSAINSAQGGAVLCIPRGTTFSGGLVVTNTAPTANNRVIVCSSADGRCSRTGGANVRINSGTSVGLDIRANVDGFTFRNLDFYGSGDYGLSMNKDNIQYITFDGGRFDGYVVNGCNAWLTTTPCREIDLGVIGNPLNFSNTGTNGFYGWLEDSRVTITGLNNGSPHNFFHHIFYLSSANKPHVMRNITFEGGEYVANGNTPSSWGMFLNLAGKTENLIIRNNKFIAGGPNDGQASCEFQGIDIATGSDVPNEEYINTQIYGNYFRTNCLWDINIEFPGSYKIYNNVFDKRGIFSSNTGSVLHVSMRGTNQTAQVEFNNNTVYACGLSNCPTNLFSNAGNLAAVSFFNNLVYSLKSGINAAALFMDSFNQTNNHIYIPNSGIGANPLLVDPANSNFRLQSNSPLKFAGRLAGAPEVDFLGTTRSIPPSVGAYEN